MCNITPEAQEVKDKIWISTSILYHDASVQISCCTDNDIKHFIATTMTTASTSSATTAAVATTFATVTTTAAILVCHIIHQTQAANSM